MSEQMAKLLRQKILESGLSANGLSKIIDIKQQTLSTFLRGEGISLATAEKIATHFGLVLIEQQKRKPKVPQNAAGAGRVSIGHRPATKVKSSEILRGIESGDLQIESRKATRERCQIVIRIDRKELASVECSRNYHPQVVILGNTVQIRNSPSHVAIQVKISPGDDAHLIVDSLAGGFASEWRHAWSDAGLPD